MNTYENTDLIVCLLATAFTGGFGLWGVLRDSPELRNMYMKYLVSGTGLFLICLLGAVQRFTDWL